MRAPGLVVKCINHERDPEAHAQLCAAAAGHPDIEIMDRYLSPADNSSLTALVDCYVSLHRAEGFGLGMAEAMALGKPVIATGYSGNLDFMTADEQPARRLPAGPDRPGRRSVPRRGAVGGSGSPARLASDARVVRRPRAGHDELGATAAADIRRTHSPEAAGQIMRRRLEVDPRDRPPASRGGPGPQTPGDGGAAGGARAGPATHGPTRTRPGNLGQFARKNVLRLMRPYTAYQKSVDTLVLAALQDLSDGIAARAPRACERSGLT